MSDLDYEMLYSNTLDDCLVKISRIILALGVKEISITPTTHQHVISTGTFADRQVIDSFYSQIDQIYSAIVVPNQNEQPLS